jgi:hypothetical protein
MRLAVAAFVAAAIFLALALAGVARVPAPASSPPAIVVPAASSGHAPKRSGWPRHQTVGLNVGSARWQPQ